LSREELTWFFDRMHIMVKVHDKFLFESAFLRSMQYVWFNLQKAYGISYNNLKFTVLIDNNHQETSFADQLIMNTTGVVAGAIAGAETIFIRPGDLIEDKYEYQILARNLQLICKHESRLNAVKDALAGSYALEHLTAKLTNYIWARL
jgi:methylmalonyl-CoA mutase N-terminal domain/subunit